MVSGPTSLSHTLVARSMVFLIVPLPISGDRSLLKQRCLEDLSRSENGERSIKYSHIAYLLSNSFQSTCNTSGYPSHRRSGSLCQQAQAARMCYSYHSTREEARKQKGGSSDEWPDSNATPGSIFLLQVALVIQSSSSTT